MAIDENLPPALARSLQALFAGAHEVIHLRDRFGAGVTDRDWIGRLSAEGRWVVISNDRRISRNRQELREFQRSRLIGFFFSRSLEKEKLTRKMERLMALWHSIEKQVDLAPAGAMYELPARSHRLPPL